MEQLTEPVLTCPLKLIKWDVRAQFITRCAPIQNKKRQLKMKEKEWENFEEVHKPEGTVKNNKIFKKVTIRNLKNAIRNLEYKAQKGVVICLSICITVKSGLTDQSLPSALKVLQCWSSNRHCGFKRLFCVSLCRAEFAFKANSCGLIILINFLEKKLPRQTAETSDL